MTVTVAASAGFVLAVTTFIAGVRMIRLREQHEENLIHRVNGRLTMAVYPAVAIVALVSNGASLPAVLLWGGGFALHLLKLLLVKKKLAVRYGGYLGIMIMLTWVAIIFNHLPE